MGKFAVIIVSTLVLLLSYFVISTVNTGTFSVRRNVEAFEYNRAKNIANSAAQIAVNNIINEVSGWVFDEESNGIITNHPMSSFTDWTDMGGSYRISKLEKNGSDLFLTMSGKIGERVYDAFVQLKKVESISTLFDYAVYSKKDLSIYQNGYIDSFNSNDGPELLGNAHVGYGPAGTFTNNGTINGTISHKVEKDMPSVIDPGGGDPLTIPNTTHTIPAGEYRVTHDVQLSGLTEVSFSGPTILYLEGDLKLTGNSSIVIQSGASLELYISGSLDNRGNGIFNETNIASNLIIYGTDSCDSIYLQGSTNTSFTGAIYAPMADMKIVGGNNFKIYGAMIGENVEIYRTLLFDEALSELASSGLVADERFYVVSWR